MPARRRSTAGASRRQRGPRGGERRLASDPQADARPQAPDDEAHHEEVVPLADLVIVHGGIEVEPAGEARLEVHVRHQPERRSPGTAGAGATSRRDRSGAGPATPRSPSEDAERDQQADRHRTEPAAERARPLPVEVDAGSSGAGAEQGAGCGPDCPGRDGTVGSSSGVRGGYCARRITASSASKVAGAASLMRRVLARAEIQIEVGRDPHRRDQRGWPRRIRRRRRAARTPAAARSRALRALPASCCPGRCR